MNNGSIETGSSMTTKARRWLQIILTVACAAALGLAAGCRKQPATPTGFAVPVIAAEVLVRTTTNYMEFIGQTLGGQDVEIRARVPGFLESVDFKEGTVVKSNALLYTIGDRSFRAALAQAEGRLAEVEAAWLKAQQDTNRFGPLWQRHAISRQQYDDSIANERATAASIKTARAAVESAQLDLGHTRIYAPIEGLVGKTEVKPGNVVGQGATTLLTTLSSLDPIQVRFSVNEKVFLDWRRKYEQNPKSAEGVFELILADGTVHPERGSIVFADRQVDPATGTILLEVSFPNPQRIVRPGQFARVRFPGGGHSRRSAGPTAKCSGAPGNLLRLSGRGGQPGAIPQNHHRATGGHLLRGEGRPQARREGRRGGHSEAPERCAHERDDDQPRR